MKPNSIREAAPLWLQPLRWMAYICVASYHRVAYRIRSWGALPRTRGPALLVSNHQHEIESPVIVADMGLRALAWRDPIFTVSSRRMWEPGFLAERIPWLTVLRGTNMGWLFSSIGMQPIENELSQRPLASVAYMLADEPGVEIANVFHERVLDRFPPQLRYVRDLLLPSHFTLARSYVRMNDLLEPYRGRIMHETRADIERDIAHFEDLVRDGATIFLTPEGFYTGDGKMRPLRGILSKLAPMASIWLAAISYDPYDERRLTMLYRVVPALADLPIDTQLKARRPVTTSALVCTALAATPDASDDTVERDVLAQLASLGPAAFVVPELRADPRTAVARVLRNLRTTGRTHPQFPGVDDMIAYQRNFHEETLEGLRALG